MNERDPGRRQPEEGRTARPEGDLPHVSERRGSDLRASAEDLLPDLPQDEAELRRLLRAVVEDIEPSADALEHLHTAVPARRRRRRQLLVGAAASVALFGIGAPLVVTAAANVGGGSGGTSEAGRGRPWDEDAGLGGDFGSLGGFPPGLTGVPQDNESGPVNPNGLPPGDGAEDTGGETPSDRETLGVTSPTCDRGQLGEAQTVMDPPDGQGRIYGVIRMANVSDRPCRVTGNGDLAALPVGGDTSSDVEIVDRTEGDRATGLPAPEESFEELVLPPGEAYEVRFAWVPSVGAGGSCEASPEPDPSATTGATGSATTTGYTASTVAHLTAGDDPSATSTTEPSTGEPTTTGEETTPPTDGETTPGGPHSPGDGTDEPDPGSTGGTDEPDPGGTDDPDDGSTGGPHDPGTEDPDGETPDDGVILRYTPAAGEPAAAQIRLEGSCSGTVYRTGVLEAEDPTV